MVDSVYRILYRIIDDYVPRYKKRSRFPFWFSNEVKALLKKKEKAIYRWKKNQSDPLYCIYSELRSKCKELIKACHSSYIGRLQANIHDNIKLFWAYAKSKRQSNSYPTMFTHSELTAADFQGICELFAMQFKSTFKDHYGIETGAGAPHYKCKSTYSKSKWTWKTWYSSYVF